MANELDEMNPVVNEAGRDVNVIEKQLPVKTGVGSVIFEICLWVCGILPGVIFQIMKIKAKNYFQQLQQKIQAEASNIDNYLEQRVQILQNVAPLLEKALEDHFRLPWRHQSSSRQEHRGAKHRQRLRPSLPAG